MHDFGDGLMVKLDGAYASKLFKNQELFDRALGPIEYLAEIDGQSYSDLDTVARVSEAKPGPRQLGFRCRGEDEASSGVVA